MQNAMRLFFGFRGRIARTAWWVASAIIALINATFIALTDPGYYSAPVASLGSTIANLIFLIPMTAVLVKRCNDRNWPWWTGLLVQLPLLVFGISDYLGHFADDENLTLLQGAEFSTFIVSFVFVVVDNGFLRGTVGANRYGPDPLEPSAPSTPPT